MSSSLKSLTNFHQISHWAFFGRGIIDLFKPFCIIKQVGCHGKNHFKEIFSRTKKVSRLNLGIKHRGLGVYHVCSNDDPRMTFDLSMARSNLHPDTLV